MCDIIRDVITSSACSCDTGEINAFDKIMCENQKKEKIWKKKNFFYINLDLTDRLDIEFTACYSELMSEEALTSFTVFDAYR